MLGAFVRATCDAATTRELRRDHERMAQRLRGIETLLAERNHEALEAELGLLLALVEQHFAEDERLFYLGCQMLVPEDGGQANLEASIELAAKLG